MNGGASWLLCREEEWAQGSKHCRVRTPNEAGGGVTHDRWGWDARGDI